MNKYTFNIKTAIDFLKKLIEDFEEYKVDRLSSRKAINCAMSAWHLIEWIVNDYSGKTRFKNKNKLREYSIEKCESLKIMHDIANGSKHIKLSSQKSNLKDTKLYQGAYSSAYTRAYDISDLIIEFDNGNQGYFEIEMENVINFWIEFFKKELNETI